jgi:hypothetical protein
MKGVDFGGWASAEQRREKEGMGMERGEGWSVGTVD